MPRRVATQVSQLISRQLRGGLLKSTPVAYQTLVAHPPTPLPSRAPVQRTPFDLPPPRGSSWDFDDDLTANGAGSETVAESRSARLARRNGPKLGPQPIIYLEDRVRERFYNDHPWETLQPRMLIEGNVLSERRVPHPNATDLTAWGRNPGPDDVIACVVHLHRHHGLSLSQAYHNTLSSYHALRAEHEHASRSALFEARAYGAQFTHTHDGRSTSAVEIERGFAKEGQELRKGARFFAKMFGGPAVTGLGDGTGGAPPRKYRFRVRNTWAPVSQGEKYLQAALTARDGLGGEADGSQSFTSGFGRPPLASPQQTSSSLLDLLSTPPSAAGKGDAQRAGGLNRFGEQNEQQAQQATVSPSSSRGKQ